MINWRYAIPRLTIVAGLLLFLALGVDPLARSALVAVGQRAAESKVNVERVSTSIVNAQVAIEGVSVANRHTSQRNLWEAQAIYLDLDAAALVQRRFVIEQGIVRGLVINGGRSDDGHVDYDYGIAFPRATLGDAGEKLLLDAAKLLGENLAEELESVQLARQFAARWPQEFCDLEERIDHWLVEVRQLQKLPELLGSDPLADVQQVQRAALTLQTLQEELAAMQNDFQRLQRLAKLDRGQLTAAVERDVARIEQRLQAASLDPQQLIEYLLGPKVAPRVATAMHWAKWVRDHLPDDELPEPMRERGVDVSFSADRQPWFVAQLLRVEGDVVYDDHRYPYLALVQGLSSSPRTYPQPAIFRVKLNDPLETWIEFIADRTSDARRDKVTVVCPRVAMDEVSLGDAQRLALQLPPGELAVQAIMNFNDDTIAGELRLYRSDVSFALVGDATFGGSGLAQRIERSLNEIREIDLRVVISGPIERPKAHLQSPLGHQLAAAIEGSIADEISLRRAELRNKARKSIESEIAALNECLAIQQQLARKKLSAADDQHQQLEKLIASSLGLPKQRLGRQLQRVLER